MKKIISILLFSCIVIPQYLFAENNTPLVLGFTTTITNPSCFQSCDGIIEISASGGVGTIQYSIDNGVTFSSNNVITGLCAGTYNVVIEDANSNQASSIETITEPAQLNINSITYIEPLCYGAYSGSATVFTSGGTGFLGYSWNDPAMQTAQTAVALPGGLYCVQVTDGNGCMISQCINVTEPSPLNAIADLSSTICYGESTQIWGSGQGGTAPYNITWTNPPLVGFWAYYC